MGEDNGERRDEDISRQRGFRLLSLVDTYVHNDGAVAGFVGSVALGVRGEGRELWWRGQFGTRTETRLDASRPAADAILLLGPDEAEDALTGTMRPAPGLLVVDGDRDLLQRFINRFFTTRSPLAVRMGQMARS